LEVAREVLEKGGCKMSTILSRYNHMASGEQSPAQQTARQLEKERGRKEIEK